MPNNHSTEYELNSTSHETCKSFNFNDPRIIDGINDTSGTNFARIEESTRHLFVPWRGCTARNPEIIAIWFILMRSIVEEKRQELKKGKSFDFLEERERDKNEIVPRLLENDPCPFQTEFFSSWNSQALYYAFQHMEEKKICVF